MELLSMITSAISIISSILKGAKAIGNMPCKVRRIKLKCKNLADFVSSVRDILHEYKDVNDTELMRKELGKLIEALDDARKLVESCLGARCVKLVEDRIDDVKERIRDCIDCVNLINGFDRVKPKDELAGRDHPRTNTTAGSEEMNGNADKKDVSTNTIAKKNNGNKKKDVANNGNKKKDVAKNGNEKKKDGDAQKKDDNEKKDGNEKKKDFSKNSNDEKTDVTKNGNEKKKDGNTNKKDVSKNDNKEMKDTNVKKKDSNEKKDLSKNDNAEKKDGNAEKKDGNEKKGVSKNKENNTVVVWVIVFFMWLYLRSCG